MAEKYLKYFVTRDNQYIPIGFSEYMANFPKDRHLFNMMSVHTWHLYEMIQSGFYCNWPNTAFKKYFIQAEPIIHREETTTTESNCEYFGMLFVNPTIEKLIFEVDGQQEQIDITPGLLLISPHSNEKYTITSGGEMLMIKFKINPSTVRAQDNWIPF
jgi:hypothetical protein